jgi:hypothetical protein
MDELIINGTKVDMGDSGVYLEYKSNIMGDISKIESGFSYTIKLPKTAHNMRVFEVVKATTESNVPYRKHEAMLLRDGLPIIRKANMTLRNMSSDSIEITLSFGAGAGVKNLLNDDRTLDKLDYYLEDRNEYIRWDRTFNFECQVADYGFKTDDINAWYHPTVDVRWVIDRISKTYGIEIDYSQINDRLDMRMPLLRRNGIKSEVTRLDLKDTYLNSANQEDVVIADFICSLAFNPSVSDDYGLTYKKAYTTNAYYSYLVPKRINTKLTLSGVMEYTYTDNKGDLEVFLSVVVCSKGRQVASLLDVIKKEIARVLPLEVRTNTNGTKTAVFSFADAETEMTEIVYASDGKSPKDFVVAMVLPREEYNSPHVVGQIDVQTEYKVNTYDYGYDFANASTVANWNNLEGDFYIVPNLPEIKVVDFLKGICAVAGAYATVEGKTITLRSRDSIVNGVQEWKHKKIEDVGLSFSVSDVAQKNMFKYKDGEAFSGSFNVDDETLPWSATLIELPFSELKVAYSGNLYFPLYSYDNEGKQTFTEDKGAYICTSLEDARAYYLTVDGLRWSQLLDKHYQTYIKMVSKAKVKTCKYRLSPLDLMELDMNKCVYDDGALWAIQTIKTKSGDVCDVELIKV